MPNNKTIVEHIQKNNPEGKNSSPSTPLRRASRSNALSGANLEYAHKHNQRVILETVRLHGPLSRVEISRHTALSTQTVSNIVDKLLESDILQIGARRSGLRGQPAVEIDLNPKGGYAIGLHLDRDHMVGVLLDLCGGQHQLIQHEWNFPTPEDALPCLKATVISLYRREGLRKSDIWGVGLALPGPLDLQAGRLVSPPNFPGWDGVPISDLLSDAVDLPVFLENDATAAAVGERWFGQGREVRNYFYVFFGVGVGGGMVIDGKPYRGAFNTAAMFGHISVEPHGERCLCGGRGCLELYISLASLYASIDGPGETPHSVAEVTKHFEDQDPRLLAWIDQAADHLAPALVTLENLLNPEAIVFGGRFPAPVFEALLSRVRVKLSDAQMSALAHHPRLLRAHTDNNAAALGAATLPLFESFTPSGGVMSSIQEALPIGM